MKKMAFMVWIQHNCSANTAFVLDPSNSVTPQPLYNTVVGVHSINRVS